MEAYFQWLREKHWAETQATAQRASANHSARDRPSPLHSDNYVPGSGGASGRSRDLGFFALYSIPSLPGYTHGPNSRSALSPSGLGPFYCFLNIT